jgi:hypothetical protein
VVGQPNAVQPWLITYAIKAQTATRMWCLAILPPELPPVSANFIFIYKADSHLDPVAALFGYDPPYDVIASIQGVHLSWADGESVADPVAQCAICVGKTLMNWALRLCTPAALWPTFVGKSPESVVCSAVVCPSSAATLNVCRA